MNEGKHPFVQALDIMGQDHSDAEFAVLLQSPLPMLDNWTPIQLLGAGRSDELLKVAQGLDDGVYA